jgi:hypothetical protein
VHDQALPCLHDFPLKGPGSSHAGIGVAIVLHEKLLATGALSRVLVWRDLGVRCLHALNSSKPYCLYYLTRVRMGLPLLIEKGGVESGMRAFKFAEDSLLVFVEVLVVKVGS